ncbi:hypothetical protein DXG03_005493 [Asterophora parasitica]|uniref:Isomerase YbhE n=1 Tax=Asterophora parasitica TaxID=117018 RepID=A0A9P7KBE5_9AGAR|nr:hypothetical protein DXG03_005493 [Asterophora parasitica]
MVSFKILAGGYDVFVATYLFNSNTSTLSLVSKSPTGPSPSATNEVDNGALQSFVINSAGALLPAVDTITSGGSFPAFTTALSSGSVAVFNYGSGNGRILPTTSSPLKFNAVAPVIVFPQPQQPSTSHPHMVVEYGNEVFVPDLGGDTVWRLSATNTATGSYAIKGQIAQPKGSGPRHIAFLNQRLFTIHELDNTLTIHTIPTVPNGTASLLASANIVPPNAPAGAKFFASGILIPPTTKAFPTPYIYVANRNLGTQDVRGDAIAIYEHINVGKSNEGLKFINHVYTGINQPRGLEFGPADGRGGEAFLAVGGVAGNAGVKVFKRVDGGRTLELVATNWDIPTRTAFVWV